MVSQHANSPCCGARVRRYGGKRRQCLRCKKTWSIRPLRRGRRRKRLSDETLLKVIRQGYPLKHFARRRPHLKPITFRHHFRNLLRSYVTRPRRITLPPGPLVILMDGLWFQFGGSPWVLYQIALKPCAGTTAVFLDPTLLPGRESRINWEKAVATIPEDLQQRIVGIVVDNLHGMRLLSRHHRWVLQLCQFHLTLKLYGRRGMIPHAIREGSLRQELKTLIRKALSLPAGIEFDAAIKRASEIALEPLLAPRMRGLIREFLRNRDHYRACIRHPELGLPNTTNAVESMGARIRRVLQRHKAASSPRALTLWATAVTRASPDINCTSELSTE
jgi:transposase-like protein